MAIKWGDFKLCFLIFTIFPELHSLQLTHDIKIPPTTSSEIYPTVAHLMYHQVVSSTVSILVENLNTIYFKLVSIYSSFGK